MHRVLLVMLAVAACASPCAAAPFAIKCLDRAALDAYVTFDPDRKQAIYETGGGRFIKGRITATAPGRIAFLATQDTLQNFEVVWDEAAGTLSWKEASSSGPVETIRCAPTPLGRRVPKFEDIPPLQ